MAIPFTARAALLQALRAGPGYGLDLIRRVWLLTGRDVRLRQGAVYPALKALETEGLLTQWTVVPGRRRGGRSRTYYDLTPRGVRVSDAERAALSGLVADRLDRAVPPRRERALMAQRLRRAARVSSFVRMLEDSQGRRQRRVKS